MLKSFSWSARFVRIPVTMYSRGARRIRAAARSRVGAQILVAVGHGLRLSVPALHWTA
jgi:hypothetical protein